MSWQYAIGSGLLRRSELLYRIGLAALIIAWPLLILTGVFALPTWCGWIAFGLAFGGAGIAIGGVLLDVIRTELEVS